MSDSEDLKYQKLQRVLIFVILFISLLSHVFYWLSLPKTDRNFYDLASFVKFTLYEVQSVVLCLLALFLILKNKFQKGDMLIALFLALLNLNMFFFEDNTLASFVFIDAWFVVTGVTFVASVQYFPRQVTARDINDGIRNKIFRMYLCWLLKGRNLWGFFAFTLVALQVTAKYIFAVGEIVRLIILVNAFLFLLVGYKSAQEKDRDKLLWLFWGLFTYILLIIFSWIMDFFDVSPPVSLLDSLLSICFSLVLIISWTMSLFFANTFDTGFIVKRTVINGALFIFIVVVYNTLEDFFTDWVAASLGISNSFFSSIISGFLVVLAHPMNERLTKLLNTRIKNSESAR